MSSQNDQDILTLAEVSRMYGISLARLRRWRVHNRGPLSFLRNNRVVYRRSSVEAWFAAQEAATLRGG